MINDALESHLNTQSLDTSSTQIPSLRKYGSSEKLFHGQPEDVAADNSIGTERLILSGLCHSSRKIPPWPCTPAGTPAAAPLAPGNVHPSLSLTPWPPGGDSEPFQTAEPAFHQVVRGLPCVSPSPRLYRWFAEAHTPCSHPEHVPPAPEFQSVSAGAHRFPVSRALYILF